MKLPNSEQHATRRVGSLQGDCWCLKWIGERLCSCSWWKAAFEIGRASVLPSPKLSWNPLTQCTMAKKTETRNMHHWERSYVIFSLVHGARASLKWWRTPRWRLRHQYEYKSRNRTISPGSARSPICRSCWETVLYQTEIPTILWLSATKKLGTTGIQQEIDNLIYCCQWKLRRGVKKNHPLLSTMSCHCKGAYIHSCFQFHNPDHVYYLSMTPLTNARSAMV